MHAYMQKLILLYIFFIIARKPVQWNAIEKKVTHSASMIVRSIGRRIEDEKIQGAERAHSLKPQKAHPTSDLFLCHKVVAVASE